MVQGLAKRYIVETNRSPMMEQMGYTNISDLCEPFNCLKTKGEMKRDRPIMNEFHSQGTVQLSPWFTGSIYIA